MASGLQKVSNDRCGEDTTTNNPPFRAQQKCGPIAQGFYKDLSALHYYGLPDRQATFAETK